MKSYLKNYSILINKIKKMNTLPPHAKLFTTNVVSMYTNIDKKVGISAFKHWIQLYDHELPPNFPITLCLEMLKFIMSNIFQFDDTHWLQCKGIAMGMPTACAYATISFSSHECLNLLPNFQHNLLYCKRYIDDIFATWVDLPTHENPNGLNLMTSLMTWAPSNGKQKPSPTL